MYLIYKEIPELLQLLPCELWLLIQKQLFTNNLNTITDKLRFPTYTMSSLGFRGVLSTHKLIISLYASPRKRWIARYQFLWFAYDSKTYSKYSRCVFERVNMSKEARNLGRILVEY